MALRNLCEVAADEDSQWSADGKSCRCAIGRVDRKEHRGAGNKK
jgi:hypothetical protein